MPQGTPATKNLTTNLFTRSRPAVSISKSTFAELRGSLATFISPRGFICDRAFPLWRPRTIRTRQTFGTQTLPTRAACCAQPSTRGLVAVSFLTRKAPQEASAPLRHAYQPAAEQSSNLHVDELWFQHGCRCRDSPFNLTGGGGSLADQRSLESLRDHWRSLIHITGPVLKSTSLVHCRR